MNFAAQLPAVGYALGAGIATGIGGFLVLLYRKTNARLLAAMLGFSAGVMIYVSFTEIFPEAETILSGTHGIQRGRILAVLSFFFGIVLAALLDELVPEPNNPHGSRRLEEADRPDYSRFSGKLYKTGIFTAIAITTHNFPEGIAAFISGVRNPVLGISIALAIAIHNIPEGISIAIPIYYATRSRKRAFLLSALSGLSEPLGAILTMLILGPIISDTLFGLVFAAVAGIMVYISLDELLPAAREYGEHHLSILGLVLGMGVMAVSVLLIF
jgi:ZIP family zinc transporter